MDNREAAKDFGWRLGAALPEILEEMASHAQANPDWLERSEV